MCVCVHVSACGCECVRVGACVCGCVCACMWVGVKGSPQSMNEFIRLDLRDNESESSQSNGRNTMVAGTGQSSKKERADPDVERPVGQLNEEKLVLLSS